MSGLRDAIDHTLLGWIKPELDEVLRQARIELEGFVEAPDDPGRMRLCAGYLHQAQGTLCMVELHAPAMVVEDMARLADALRDDATADRDIASAALLRGMRLLPDYLERLQSGHPDNPIVLLPLLNALRAARGETALNENILFAPDLARALPDTGLVEEAGIDPDAALRDVDATLDDQTGATEIETVPASVDDLLLEILDSEVQGHLQTVGDWLGAIDAGTSADGERLLRALHTMHGAFAMAEVPAIGLLLGPTEEYARRLLAAGGVPDADVAPVLDAVYVAVREALRQLHGPEPRIAVSTGLAAQVRALRDRLPEAPIERFELDLPDDFDDGDDAERLAHEAAERAGLASLDAERIEIERLEQERLAAEGVARDEAEQAERARLEARSGPDAHRQADAARIAPGTFESLRRQAQIDAGVLEAERMRAEQNDPDAPLALDGLDPALIDSFVEEGIDLLDHSDALLALDGDTAEDEENALRGSQAQVRIRTDLLDTLVTCADEVAIYRARLEQQFGAFRGAMHELAQANTRLRDQVRRLDSEIEAIVSRHQREGEDTDTTFDPLELDRVSTLQQLSRALGETASDFGSLQQRLEEQKRQYETLLTQQSRVSADLQAFRAAAPAEDDAPVAASPVKTLQRDLLDLESRTPGLSLVDPDSDGHGPVKGVVLIAGGLGGPDAVRQLLGALPEGFPRPVLVRLQLDGGRYDRLVRQMGRATWMPVQLAEAGMTLSPGEVYFLPPGLLPVATAGELRFAGSDDVKALADTVPANDSALLFLSGADPSLVDVAMGPAWQGALVGAQNEEGCYDPVAARAVAQRGGSTGSPTDIADWLIARWMPRARGFDSGGLSL